MRSDPLSERDERKIVKHVLGEIDRYCDQIVSAGFDRVIGTSGTILSIGAVAATAARGGPRLSCAICTSPSSRSGGFERR